MRVKVVRSFSAQLDDGIHHYGEGVEFELPDGVDWLKAGFVVPVRGPIERAVVEAREKAVEIHASPAAVHYALEHGINLANVKGTGVDGNILKSDVEKAIEE